MTFRIQRRAGAFYESTSSLDRDQPQCWPSRRSVIFGASCWSRRTSRDSEDYSAEKPRAAALRYRGGFDALLTSPLGLHRLALAVLARSSVFYTCRRNPVGKGEKHVLAFLSSCLSFDLADHAQSWKFGWPLCAETFGWMLTKMSPNQGS